MIKLIILYLVMFVFTFLWCYKFFRTIEKLDQRNSFLLAFLFSMFFPAGLGCIFFATINEVFKRLTLSNSFIHFASKLDDWLGIK